MSGVVLSFTRLGCSFKVRAVLDFVPNPPQYLVAWIGYATPSLEPAVQIEAGETFGRISLPGAIGNV